ncbi:hypothetical protein SO802_032676 [Lithocarpus litseifolius]|uniref:Uncharacterized protein n=1 Tax=Lithocarpus litseifolius TaxID=425828 RepID=A0AAW2BB23_9ROSI
MVPGFEILLDCHNKVLELKKEDTTWVPTDWADYLDIDAMTTLLRDPICNIEEEDYWEACQFALKSPYELKSNQGKEEGSAPKDAREEVEQANNVDYDDYSHGRPLNWSCITDVSSRFGPQYDKHGKEIPELGSYYNLELGSLTPHTEEEDDIDAKLAAMNLKLMVHSLRIMTLENA